MSPDTICAAKRQFSASGLSYRKFGRQLGVPAYLLSDVIHERHAHVSIAAENRLRVALSLPVIATYEVPACPDCGAVHTGRCHGVADPVVVVRKQRPPSPPWLTAAATWLRERERTR